KLKPRPLIPSLRGGPTNSPPQAADRWGGEESSVCDAFPLRLRSRLVGPRRSPRVILPRKDVSRGSARLLQCPQMKRSEFQRVVQRALDELPPQFSDALHNIDIQVRWRPTVHELRQAGLHHGSALFGMYTGASLPKPT